jgi:hypothetical protein
MTRLALFFLALQSVASVTGLSQQASTGPNYKILDGSLFIVMGSKLITLANDQNFMLEDITPCSAATQYSPAYSCTDWERMGTVSSLHVVYPQTACTTADTATVAELTCLKDPTSGTVITGKISKHANQNRNLIVVSYKPNEQTKQMLLGGRLYRFTYWTREKDQTGNVTVKPNSVSLDTRPVVTLSVQSAQSGVNQIILNTPLAFSQDGTRLASTSQNCVTGAGGPRRSVTLPSTGTTLRGETFPLQQNALSDTSSPIDLLLGMKYLGQTVLCVPPVALANPFTPTSVAAGSVIQAAALSVGGGAVNATLIPGICAGSADVPACVQRNPTAWTFDSATKLVAPLHQPTGKGDSAFYANINIVAGTGAKFAWGLDGKLAEIQGKFIGNSSITLLSATANVGNNTSNIKGQTYTDSIDWTLPISYDWKKWPGTFVFAPDYSTDIEFDRKNMLADTHVMWTALFHPLAWNTALESGADAKYSSTSIKPGVGGRLFVQGGLEAGGAIINTVQKASSGNAKITVPAYNVARIVPQLHGILEWKPAKGAGIGVFTFEETFNGRYLLKTENTVEQYNIPATGSTAASIGLHLRPVSGWKGYNSFVTTWFPPHSANAGLGITYNDGFNAPKFSRANSVTVGLTILF